MDEKEEEEIVVDNPVVNAFLNDSDNGSDNAAEIEENSLDNEKNDAEEENEPLESAADNTVDNESTLHGEQEENTEELDEELEEEFEDEFPEDGEGSPDEEEEEDNFDFPDDEDDYEDEDEDILENYAEEEDDGEKRIEDVVNDATGDSAKNIEALKDLGELAIDFLDDTKAQLCSAISGQASSQYASGKKLNKALLKAFVAYMNSQDVKAPSPAGTLLLTLALWGLPALGTAYFHRKQVQKANKKKAKEQINQGTEKETEEEVRGESKSDGPKEQEPVNYKETKECKDKRRMFDLHASTGCYSRDLSGKFAKASLAGEKPSPELQELIDKGCDNVKIRSILYPK
jgi:hypothetical protein